MKNNSLFALERIRVAWQQAAALPQTPKYLALYKAIKNCVLNHELPNNWGLPSSRILAKELAISRATVLMALDLLLLEKLIVAKPGSGYRIHHLFDGDTSPTPPIPINLSDHRYPTISEKGRAFLKNIDIINRQPEVGIAFKPGLPPMDVFPINQWKNLMNIYWRYVKASDLSYGPSSGTQQLKQQICNYLHVSRSIKATPDQIVVVSGSLQSLYLIAAALIEKGDGVVLENPTFPNVHSIFKSFSAQLIPADLDAAGMQLDAVPLERGQVKLIHVTPSNHYPLGIKMSLQRRLELLSRAATAGAYIIENDYEHELANWKNAVPTLFSLDKEHRTIYLGTFNRLLYPSIRLGYMLVPPQLAPVISALQEHSHRFVSPALQMVMSQFIERNYLFQHLKELMTIAQQRHLYFTQHFEKLVPGMQLLSNEFNSLHAVAIFKKPVDVQTEQAILEVLAQNGLSAFALSKCALKQPVTTGLILGYSTVREVVIQQKLQQMGQLIRPFLV